MHMYQHTHTHTHTAFYFPRVLFMILYVLFYLDEEFKKFNIFCRFVFILISPPPP